MKVEVVEKILVKLENIDKRLMDLEESTAIELQKLHSAVELLRVDQQEDVIITLERLDAKMTAILETQKLNVEIMRVFSGDSVQH